MSVFVTNPTFTMATTEKLPLGFDASAYLEGGQTCSTPIVTLTDTDGDVPVELAAPVATGSMITQEIDGSKLLPLHTYRLIATFTASPSTRWSMAATITVRF